jgi:flagellar hook-associated protein 3 FlgL
MMNTADDRKLQYKEQLSNLQDLDYAEALTSVSQQKMQLEAAQSTYALTAKLSLFDYIS